MKSRSSGELRKLFIDYFLERGHTLVPSAPLIPPGDPTLLFTVAGMVQFKKYYSSKETPELRRATSIQKCLRATDLDEVGHTRKHHTFFEMMGNFSFGDYFKKEAIEWGWDFLTNLLGLPREQLWVSVFEEDEEAREIWERHIGLARERVVGLGPEDNFWGPAGKTGPCGPCSEIYIDLGPEVGCGRPECAPGCECDRYAEIWNLVFPQFDQREDGTRGKLAHPGVDTGMGFERLAMVVQGVDTTFETDLIKPVLDVVTSKASPERLAGKGGVISARIVADHARALTFAIGEGILPSNEARGYLIRRLLRRAAYRGKVLGVEGSFLHELPRVVVSIFGEAYPELRDSLGSIEEVVRSEEERFARTLEEGIARFEDLAAGLKEKGEKVVSGSSAFYLYDTLGLPFELIEDMGREEGLEVDRDGFERELEKQRERARQASAFLREGSAESAGSSGVWNIVTEGEHSIFLGYEKSVVEPVVLRRWRSAEDGRLELVLSETPFYAEAGGQVSDRGEISGPGLRFQVESVYREGEFIVHSGRLVEGDLGTQPLEARIDQERRSATARNHTATHLLHQALRRILGTHVQQTGSLVSPERLRFDFSHFKAMSREELDRVEQEVNRRILEDLPVRTRITSLSEARSEGALAFFGEKYGERVRLVEVGGYSKELCAGTHLSRTGEMGQLLIVSESAVGAGLRRIEAVTGRGALELAREAIRRLDSMSKVVKVSGGELEERVRALMAEKDRLSRELERVRDERLASAIPEVVKSAERFGGYTFAVLEVDGGPADKLRAVADRLREAIDSGVGLIVSRSPEKVTFVAVVTEDLLASRKIKASDVVGAAARAVGGRGGGKPHLAIAGGRKVERVEQAVSEARGFVMESLGKS